MDWEETMRPAEGNMQVGLWEVHSRIYAESGYGLFNVTRRTAERESRNGKELPSRYFPHEGYKYTLKDGYEEFRSS